MNLREWTGWRVAAAWVLWFVLALGGALGAAIAYARIHEPPAPSGTRQGAGPTIGPSYSLALDGRFVLGVLLGPPALLTAVWLWQRVQRRRAAT